MYFISYVYFCPFVIHKGLLPDNKELLLLLLFHSTPKTDIQLIKLISI